MIGTAGDYTMGDDGRWSGPDALVVQALELAYPSDSGQWLPVIPGSVQAACAVAKDRGWPLVLNPDYQKPLPEGAVS